MGTVSPNTISVWQPYPADRMMSSMCARHSCRRPRHLRDRDLAAVRSRGGGGRRTRTSCPRVSAFSRASAACFSRRATPLSSSATSGASGASPFSFSHVAPRLAGISLLQRRARPGRVLPEHALQPLHRLPVRRVQGLNLPVAPERRASHARGQAVRREMHLADLEQSLDLRGRRLPPGSRDRFSELLPGTPAPPLHAGPPPQTPRCTSRPQPRTCIPTRSPRRHRPVPLSCRVPEPRQRIRGPGPRRPSRPEAGDLSSPPPSHSSGEARRLANAAKRPSG